MLGELGWEREVRPTSPAGSEGGRYSLRRSAVRLLQPAVDRKLGVCFKVKADLSESRISALCFFLSA